MGFFSDIKDKIFGRHAAQPDMVLAQAPSAGVTGTPAATSAAPAATPAAPAAASAPAAAAPVAPAPGAAGSGEVDVAAVLDAAVAKSGQTLDWRHSIVDLMKALGIDSSLAARKELAGELNYTGSTDDSATMNIWLHKAVIQKLADNGGKVPAELL